MSLITDVNVVGVPARASSAARFNKAVIIMISDVDDTDQWRREDVRPTEDRRFAAECHISVPARCYVVVRGVRHCVFVSASFKSASTSATAAGASISASSAAAAGPSISTRSAAAAGPSISTSSATTAGPSISTSSSTTAVADHSTALTTAAVAGPSTEYATAAAAADGLEIGRDRGGDCHEHFTHVACAMCQPQYKRFVLDLKDIEERNNLEMRPGDCVRLSFFDGHMVPRHLYLDVCAERERRAVYY